MIGWNEVIPMIELKVEEYCHGCTYFEPVSDMDIFYGGEERVAARTVVRCINSEKCKGMHRHIERSLENVEN